MPAVILDACGTINLYATGRFVPLLTKLKQDWYIPAAVMRETKYVRQPDPDDASKLVAVAIDLQPALSAGVLKPCDCQGDAELELYVELAAQIRDDGESMGLAIAKCRGWHIVTDDRKARRIAGELGLTLLSTPEVIKAWATVSSAAETEVAQVLQNIQTFARFTPNSSLPECAWWTEAINKRPR
jgi:predicted nucleic acid-binding protein